MADLFTRKPSAPLAEILRPSSLDDVVGQKHLVGPKGALRLAVQAKKLPSMILWGPPGCGKTTLARILAQSTGDQFLSLSATSAGVKEIREHLDQAQRSLDMRDQKSVLFLDEIHRLNKGQQDALLPHVEAGLVTLIGATTENPSFEVNSALLSRCQVFVLQTLEEADFKGLLQRTKEHLPAYELTPEALSLLCSIADGDARKFLGTLEHVAHTASALKHSPISAEFVGETAGSLARRFDKNGDYFYDLISAFQKTIRGSDPNAALYWLARLVDSGVDLKYVARRLVVMASEEVGNADPRALEVAVNAALAYERLGSPEGELHLAQAATYIAVAPKSNAVYAAWKTAKAFVAKDGTRPVPMKLRNAPTSLMKTLGANEGYRYAHDEPDAFAAGEKYFPDDMEEKSWYQPNPRGLEIKIADKLTRLQDSNAKARK